MTREEEMEIWNHMTPERRDYDRFVGKIPKGASWVCETKDGQHALEDRQKNRGLSLYEQGCSCHINPPCDYCIRESYDDENR